MIDPRSRKLLLGPKNESSESRLAENLWTVHQQRASRTKRLGKFDADLTADVTVFGVVLVEQTRLIPAKDGLINAKGSYLCLVNVAHIDREIKSVPSWLHPAMSEE